MTKDQKLKIKVSELFYSLQGEGLHSGTPSVFLRTFGCNFRCRGFGRTVVPANETHNPEVAAVVQAIEQYSSYDQLPLVSTGCDSYAAVYPEFKNFSPMLDIDQLVDRMLQQLPECNQQQWGDVHLVISGGEPLLGWQRAYGQLLAHDRMQSLKHLTFETNGTQALTDDFKDELGGWLAADDARTCTFSVSAKLSCSGEARSEAICPEVVVEYEDYGTAYLKFVVTTADDVTEALETLDVYRSNGFTGRCYLMPEGGTTEVYALNNRQVADLALENGLHFSDRLQVTLYKNAWGT